jgi:hypothetical protein
MGSFLALASPKRNLLARNVRQRKHISGIMSTRLTYTPDAGIAYMTGMLTHPTFRDPNHG